MTSQAFGIPIENLLQGQYLTFTEALTERIAPLNSRISLSELIGRPNDIEG